MGARLEITEEIKEATVETTEQNRKHVPRNLRWQIVRALSLESISQPW